MSRLLLLLLSSLALLARPARGQAGRPLPLALSDSAAAEAREDTAVAVQRLFLAKRRLRPAQLILPAIVVGFGSYGLAADTRYETAYQRASAVGFGLVVGYYAVQLLVVPVRQWRYRAARERRLLDHLDQGQPLPRGVRRQLRPAYFGVKAESR